MSYIILSQALSLPPHSPKTHRESVPGYVCILNAVNFLDGNILDEMTHFLTLQIFRILHKSPCFTVYRWSGGFLSRINYERKSGHTFRGDMQ